MTYWDPNAPAPDDPATPAVSAANPQSAASEWTQALARPEVRGALLQFGLNLMQPPSFGQTGFGKLAEGIGSAGEQVGRLDTENRAEREQTRKEAETSSLAGYREDQSENSRIRSEAARTSADALASLRTAQVQVQQSKAAQLDAQVEMLKMKVIAEPANQAAKDALNAARTEAAQANAELLRTKAAFVPVTAKTAQDRIDATNRRLDQGAETSTNRIDAQDRRTYETARIAHENTQTFSRNKTPFPSFPEWLASRGGRPRTDTTAPATQTAPVADVSVEMERAKNAIAAGKDPNAVRALFRERTGQDLP